MKADDMTLTSKDDEVDSVSTRNKHNKEHIDNKNNKEQEERGSILNGSNNYLEMELEEDEDVDVDDTNYERHSTVAMNGVKEVEDCPGCFSPASSFVV